MDVREKLVELSDIQVLQREIECVKRKSATNCSDCLNCDLLMTDDRILSAYANAIAALQNANGVMVQEWIPVTERLPSIDERILVYDGDVDTGIFYKGAFQTFDENGYPFEISGVTHWMPMPQPPKGE